MSNITLVTGEAGSGKTKWLMDKVTALAPAHVVDEHGQVLAITRMHGARRRLETKLQETCPHIRVSVRTIDSLALMILNRWRTSLGHERPISAAPGDLEFASSIVGIEAGFEQILRAAARLLEHRTILQIMAKTFPLVLIDEFQDCHGPLLDFVMALSRASSMLVAADDFQLLESGVKGCPATNWVYDLRKQGQATIDTLDGCHRTEDKAILDAARCIRNNAPPPTTTVPVYCCPDPKGLVAAWKIAEVLVFGWYTQRWKGTTALICPSHDPLLDTVVEKSNSLIIEKGYSPIRWHRRQSNELEQTQLLHKLAYKPEDAVWTQPAQIDGDEARFVSNQVQEYAKVRGLRSIPGSVLVSFVGRMVTNCHAYSSAYTKYEITTVHGAKNREFDNVIVLWSYRVRNDPDQKRRLLYNAITRAKKNCIVLLPFGEKVAREDVVLALLGPPEPPAKKKSKNKKQIAGRLNS